jgi:hypothetical protein
MKQKWLSQINRPTFVPSPFSTVCSCHFEENCFILKTKRRDLKEDAVPTIFENTKNEIVAETKQNNQAISDHNYTLPNRKDLKRRNSRNIETIISLKKKLKLALQSKRRLLKKCQSLKDVVDNLSDQKLVSDYVSEVLQDTASKVPEQLFKRLIDSKTNPEMKNKIYSTELKSFALTLQFYSSKAYNYVRENFGLCLPHEATIRYNVISIFSNF